MRSLKGRAGEMMGIASHGAHRGHGAKGIGTRLMHVREAQGLRFVTRG